MNACSGQTEIKCTQTDKFRLKRLAVICCVETEFRIDDIL